MEEEINHSVDDPAASLASINQILIDSEKMEIEALKQRLNEFLLLPHGRDALEGFMKEIKASQGA